MSKAKRREDIKAVAAAEDLAGEAARLAVKHGIRPNDAVRVTGEMIHRGAEVKLDRKPPVEYPTLKSAMTDLVDVITAEQRRDCDLSLSQLTVDPHTGWLSWGSGQRPYLRRAYGQLCASLQPRPVGMARYHLSVPPHQRKMCFDLDVARGKDREITLRFRQAPVDETHHIYAVVTPQYRKYDPDELARDLLKVFDGREDQVRCTTAYEGVSTRVKVFASDEATATGATAYASVTSADDGSASVQVHAGVQLPTNAQFVCSHGPLARILHRGNPDRFRGELEAAINSIDSHVAPWLELWRARCEIDAPDTMETCIAALCGALPETADKPWFVATGEAAADVTRKLVDVWTMLEMDNTDPSQAALAHVFAAAAVQCAWVDEATLSKLEGAANALLTMRPQALDRLVHPPKQSKQGVAAVNLDLSEAILERRARANKWRQRAAEAREAGDAQGADEADERAALIDIEGDVIEETGDAA